VRPNGFVADPFGRPGSAPAPSQAADPFAAAPPQSDPFGSADPFQATPAASPPAAGADPFAASDPFTDPSGGGFGAVDAFVATVASPAPGLPTSAVTDLSDLLGSSAPPPQALASPAATPPPEPSGILDTGFDFDTSAAPEPALEVEPRQAPPVHEPFDAGSDLALDERTPDPGISVAPMTAYGDLSGADPFEDQGPALKTPPAPHAGIDAVDFDAFGSAGEAPPPAPFAFAPPAPARAGAPAPEAGAQAPAVEPEEEVAAPPGGFRRTSRVRAIAVNAVSLVALLAVALGILALWRGARSGVGGILRPAAILGGGGAESEPFSATQVRSGIYERPDAPPLLFVTGTAVSNAAGPVAALRVRVEVVRRGAVVARGEGRAGAVPTPEELCGSRDTAGLGAALERIASRAQPSVKPGDKLPFLVAIADFPSDVAGAGLRVAMEPMDAPPPPHPPAPGGAPAPEPTSPAEPPEGAKKP
jgi:hypothetical protein